MSKANKVIRKAKRKENVGKTKQAIKNIYANAKKVAGMTPVGLAIRVASQPIRAKKISNYIKKQGEKPLGTIQEQLTQAHLLRNGQLETKASEIVEQERVNTPNTSEYSAGYEAGDYTLENNEQDNIETPDPEEVEELLMEEEQEEFNFNGEPENFLDPATLGAIKLAGQKGLDVVNKKRKAQGKKPIFSKISPKLANKLAGIKGATPEEESALKQAGATLVDEVTKAKKEEEVKKMLPTIIIATLVLIVLVAGITYVATKKK